MKYIITENKLKNMFFKYMDSIYDIKYNPEDKNFIDKYGDEFGYTFGGETFYYGTYQIQYNINQMFDKDSDRFMFEYLTERFPEHNIKGVQNYIP